MQSLISTISQPDVTECLQYEEHPGWFNYRGECIPGGSMKTQAILTAVADAVPQDTFRPAYLALPDKPLHAAASIQWSVLPRLAVPASAPDGKPPVFMRDHISMNANTKVA